MTYSHSRVEAPLCDLESTCDWCGEPADEVMPCHIWHCLACVADCSRCQEELAEEGE